MSKQFLLFDEPEEATKKKTRNEIFTDYESFLKKFKDNNGVKTTDDCYTPDDVFQAILQWLSRTVGLVGKKIIRPFYPGGDYLACDYPEDGIVIDNPPFSILSKIVKYYLHKEIPFFLFAPCLTSLLYAKYCTCIFVDVSMKFSNGASVNTNFISNLFGDYAVMTSPELRDFILKCQSQKSTPKRKKVIYPPQVLRASNLNTLALNGVEFKIKRNECVLKDKLDNFDCFGSSLLISNERAKELGKWLNRTKEGEETHGENIVVYLSPVESKIIERLSAHS